MLSAMPVRLLTQSVLRWPPAPASAALAPGRLPLSCDALVLTPAELQALLAGGTRMGRELQSDVRWLL